MFAQYVAEGCKKLQSKTTNGVRVQSDLTGCRRALIAQMTTFFAQTVYDTFDTKPNIFFELLV